MVIDWLSFRPLRGDALEERRPAVIMWINTYRPPEYLFLLIASKLTEMDNVPSRNTRHFLATLTTSLKRTPIVLCRSITLRRLQVQLGDRTVLASGIVAQ